MTDTWTMLELHQALREVESDLRRAGNSDNTVHTYVDRADRFSATYAVSTDPTSDAAGEPRCNSRLGAA